MNFCVTHLSSTLLNSSLNEATLDGKSFASAYDEARLNRACGSFKNNFGGASDVGKPEGCWGMEEGGDEEDTGAFR
jgi:hypothetical protein